MREILFRGKRIDNGEWVEGLLTIDDFALVDKGVERRYCIKSVPHDIGGSFVWVPVIPATVGQYTGLKDKNGRRIFEGDIIKMSDGEIGAVAYSDDCAGYDLTRGGCTLCLSQANERLVIGNIHDNPELLNGGVENGRF